MVVIESMVRSETFQKNLLEKIISSQIQLIRV